MRVLLVVALLVVGGCGPSDEEMCIDVWTAYCDKQFVCDPYNTRSDCSSEAIAYGCRDSCISSEDAYDACMADIASNRSCPFVWGNACSWGVWCLY
jgi:hypothetical protein